MRDLSWVGATSWGQDVCERSHLLGAFSRGRKIKDTTKLRRRVISRVVGSLLAGVR